MSTRALSTANRCSLRPKVASCDVYVLGKGIAVYGEGLENEPKSNSGAVPNGKLAFSRVGWVMISSSIADVVGGGRKVLAKSANTSASAMGSWVMVNPPYRSGCGLGFAISVLGGDVLCTGSGELDRP